MNKNFLFTLLTVLILGIAFWSLKTNDERKIKNLFQNLQKEFSVDPGSNVVKKAGTILKICKCFDQNFDGCINRISVNGSHELKESVSWMIHFLAPIETDINFPTILISDNLAEIFMDVSIKNSKGQKYHKPNYTFKITLKKKNRQWLVYSVYEQ